MDANATLFNSICTVLESNAMRSAVLDAFENDLITSSITAKEKGELKVDLFAKLYATDCQTAYNIAFVSPSQQLQAEVYEEQIAKTIAETLAVQSANELTKQQQVSESMRQQELQVGIVLKKIQTTAARIAALTEQDRRSILTKSTIDNTLLKMAEYLVNYLKVCADGGVTITGELHQEIKTAIESVKYAATISMPAAITIPDIAGSLNAISEAIPALSASKPIFKILCNPKDTAAVDENISLVALYRNRDDGVTFTWSFGDGTTATGQRLSKAYSAAGTYVITCTAFVGTAQYTLTRTLIVI